jgi:excisionase family DNA binding protein
MTDRAEYLDKAGASEYSSLSARTLDGAKAAGELPFYRFGARKVLFRRADLDKWLSSMRVEVVPVSGKKAGAT